MLISITVLGSFGPVRFIVNEEQQVASVISTALKSYAREGRLPVLGSDFNGFLLYCPGVGSDALSPSETIRSVGSKNFLLRKKAENEKNKGSNWMLISITILGSLGLIRFIVNEEQLVVSIISTALKSYAREGRLSVLRSNFNGFLLYCSDVGSDALSPSDTIGSVGSRNFLLRRKPESEQHVLLSEVVSQKETIGILKTWIHKSLHLRISSH